MTKVIQISSLLIVLICPTVFCQSAFVKNDTLFLNNNFYIRLDQIESYFKESNETISELQNQIDTLNKEANYKYFYETDPTTAFNNLAWTVPISLFIFLIGAFGLTITILIVKGFDLKMALSELKVVDLNNGTAVTKEKIYIASSSRLVIFLSALTAILLSIWIIVVSLHVYLKTGIVPEFQSLINGMIALGIGVVPYAVNKIAGSFRSGSV